MAIKHFILAIITLFASTQAATASICSLPNDYVPVAERPAHSLLYTIDGCDNPTSYLFGTFHSDNPALKPVVESARPYLLKTNRLYIEIVQDPEQAATMVQRYLMLPPESPNLEEIIGAPLYQEAREKLAPIARIPVALLPRMQPWAIALLSQYPPNQADGVVVDAQIEAMAQEAKIEVMGLESVAEQFTIFTSMPSEMQLDFLKSTLEDLPKLDDTLTSLDGYYQKRDINQIASMSRELFAELAARYPALATHLEQKLLDERNIRMVETLIPELSQSVFVAVGALHLPAKGGLFELLEAKGYQIHPVE